MTTTLPIWLSRALNLFGIVVVAVSVLRQSPAVSALPLALVGASLLAWAATALLRDRTPFPVLIAATVGGALATVPTDGVAIVPVIVAILVSIGSPGRPPWQGVSVTLVGGLLVPVGSFVSSIHPLALASIEAGVAVAAIGGFSRRQARRAQERDRELFEQRARGTALAERQAVARDIHDVLAHSLGGLVIQLEAIDAELEAGRGKDAATRVRQARELAVSGLAEARRAVDALRDDRVGVLEGADVANSLVELVQHHRMLGGVVALSIIGTPHPVAAERADALRRALQESLTNARKHAPGETVDVTVDWSDGVRLDISNPMVNEVRHDGGHGLVGMSERFARFGAATADVAGGRFVVRVRVDS